MNVIRMRNMRRRAEARRRQMAAGGRHGELAAHAAAADGAVPDLRLQHAGGRRCCRLRTGKWLRTRTIRAARTRSTRSAATTSCRANGTSLFNAFAATHDVQSAARPDHPDHRRLADAGQDRGLRASTSTRGARARLFDDAVGAAAREHADRRRAAAHEGRPAGGASFLAARARCTDGSLFMPSRDWP